MCGIIAAFNTGKEAEPVNEWVVNQLEDQLHRGSEGFGIAFVNNKTKKVFTERATELTKTLLDLRFNESNSILLHHRYPTSSENKLSQTHPIIVDSGSLKYKYLIVHNGVLHNEKELREEHINELGFVYTTDRIKDRDKKTEEEEFNDSESVAIEVAMFIEGQRKKIQAAGTIAFIALKIDKETEKIVEICFARNTNPLYMSATRGKLRLSSEGEGNQIKPDTLYTCDPETLKFKKEKCVLDTSRYTNGYVCGQGTKEEQDEYAHVARTGKESLQTINEQIAEEEEREELAKEETEEMELMVFEENQKIEKEIQEKVKETMEVMLADMYEEGPSKNNRQIIRDYVSDLGDEIEDIMIDGYQSIGEAVTKEMLVYNEITEAEKEPNELDEYEDKFTADNKEEEEDGVALVEVEAEKKPKFVWGTRVAKAKKKLGLNT